MLEKIADIEKALDNGCYLSALALALTLPDICSKVKGKIDKRRCSYAEWFDEYVYPGNYEAPNKRFEKCQFNGEACYSLRNSYLHSGNLMLKNERHNEKTGLWINCFDLFIPRGNFEESASLCEFGIGDDSYYTRINIIDLCQNICDAVKRYYADINDEQAFAIYEIKISEE